MKLLFVAATLTTGYVSAYVPPTSTTTTTITTQKTTAFRPTGRISRHPITQLKASPLPGGGTELVDLHLAIDHVLQTSSAFLSDAADAVVEDAKQGDDGWWAKYITLYKTGLTFVHSTIDEPLRNAGWDQTWGVSIFLFTAAVRTLLLPLSIEQTKSSEYTKALKPYQDDIKEKFKDNKDMLNRATAKLFEDANANPLNGCLLSLVQLPILLGLYRSVTGLAKDGQLQEPFLWIPSLEGPVSAANNYRGMEWLTEGWVDGVPSLGWEATLAFLVMPVVLVLGQKITMDTLQPPEEETDTSKMSEEEQATAERTKTILKFLPLMIGYFSLQVPAGLTIYWFTSNLFTLSQSLVIRGYYKANPPKIELPDYWDALDDVSKMSAEEKAEAAKSGIPVGPKWEDLVDEAKFHYVVQRPQLRETQSQGTVPTEMAAWVATPNGVSHPAGSDDSSDVGATATTEPSMEPAKR